MSIRIGDVEIEYTEYGCETRYKDGASYGAHPHDTPHYREITARLGYGDDILAYCREHEVCHQIVGQWLCHTGSYVMTALAHGEEPFASDALLEEIATQTLQRWLRAGERPIVGGVDWDDVKARALALLDSAGQ